MGTMAELIHPVVQAEVERLQALGHVVFVEREQLGEGYRFALGCQQCRRSGRVYIRGDTAGLTWGDLGTENQCSVIQQHLMGFRSNDDL